MHPKSASLLLFLGLSTAMVKSEQNKYCYEKCLSKSVRRDPQSNIDIFLEYQRAVIEVPTPTNVYRASELTDGNEQPGMSNNYPPHQAQGIKKIWKRHSRENFTTRRNVVSLRESMTFEPVKGVCQSKAIKATNKEIRCKPRPTIIELVSTNGRVVQNKIQTNRCTGFCNKNRVCMTAKTEIKTYSVSIITSEGGSMCSEVQVPNDTKCRCRCQTTRKDCKVNQKFDKETCSCRCSNKEEERRCKNKIEHMGTKMMWDKETCSCICSQGSQQCTTGTVWDQNQCRCSKKTDNG